MELKDFVSKTVIGLEEALKDIENKTNKKCDMKAISQQSSVNPIEFDLLVTSQESNSWNGWAKINVLGLANIWGTLEESTKVNNSNRVKFSVYLH